MTIAIIGHTARIDQVGALVQQIPDAVAFVDDGTLGATGNHHRAMRYAAAADEFLLAIEDDAILSPDFGERAKAWIARFPDRLMSFYLGTGHPPAWQDIVREQLPAADRAGRDYLELDQLIHGVCYFVPAPVALLPLLDPNDAADMGTGTAWRRLTGLPVIYPTVSLVDHADTGSVDKDPSVQALMDPRHAWRLA